MPLVIKKYAIIRNAEISVNGEMLFSDPEQDGFKKFIRAAYRHFNTDYAKFFKMDALSKLGFLSIDIVLKGEAVQSRFPAEKAGIILSNASSSLEVDEKHNDTIINREQYFPSPSNFVYTLPNIMAGEAAIKHGFRGENTVLISKEFDAELICEISQLAFDIGSLDCCVCGWVEQYQNKYESVLFLVERSAGEFEDEKSQEGIIFGPSTLLKIYKQEL